MAKNIWMVRAGRGSVSVDDFIENGLVAIGFGTVEVSSDVDKAVIEARCAAESPKASPGKIANAAGQLKRYYSEIQIGDAVTTYDSSQRIYFLGEILSSVENRTHDLGRVRRVRWDKKVLRDSLKVATRNTLGSTLTLFLVRDEAAEDMWHNAVPIGQEVVAAPVAAQVETDDEAEELIAADMGTKANEFIEDRIASLDWEQIQQLVAEILIAMGYRARVSPPGSDLGRDIMASPDGLGLQEPRIFVEVKHRKQQMGSQDIRTFLGGRVPGDRCLYVSTGGFTKEARYEADRSAIPITLIAMPELRELLVEYYDRMRPSGTGLVKLERIYWPAQ